MAVVSGRVEGVAGGPDSNKWSFEGAIRLGADGQIVSSKIEYREPDDEGDISVELDPGVCTIRHRNRTYIVTVPDEDIDLWELIQLAVELPPETPQDQIENAVFEYLESNASPLGVQLMTSDTAAEARTAIGTLSAVEIDAVIDDAIDDLINGAPGALDTLYEIAEALNNDADFATSIATAIAAKTALSVDGVFTPTYDFDTTPLEAGDLDAYTSAETDAAIVAALLTPIINAIKDAGGANVLSFLSTASAVNYLGVQNAASGGLPVVSALGTDSNISIVFNPKGTGHLIVTVGTGQTPTVRAQGSDSNHNLNLVPKGTGVVQANGVPVVTTTGTQTLTNKTLTAPAISSPTGIVKADVGLGNVDNTSNATERAATATLTNKTLTSPVITNPTGLVKADVGLSDVDNTSNATERAATATLTNKTLTAPKFADNGFIADNNGNEQIVFGTTASAVNQIKVTNASAGNRPSIATENILR